MDLNKIKEKLEKLNQQQAAQGGNKKGDLIWKPSPGKQVIRILPNIHQPDYPFVELNFYYDFGKTYLAPSTFGRPDPVIEFCENLKRQRVEKEEARENWRMAKKLEPKFRTYVPILIRGKEEEGVKFWGFGKQIYHELLSIIDDPDYGDITHPKNGRDITVEYTAAKGEGTYPDIAARVKPNQSPATEDKAVLELISKMPNIVDHFTEPTYEELEQAFQSYLKNGKPEKTEQPKRQEPKDDDFDPKAYTPASGPKDEVVVDKVSSVVDDFENLFND